MKALITATFDERALKELENLGIKVIYKDWRTTRRNIPEKELISLLNSEKIDIFITEIDNIDEEVINQTNLKLIAYCRGDPTRHVDLEALTKKKIPLLHAPGRNADAVAELTIGLMIATLRKIVKADRILRNDAMTVESLEHFVSLHQELEGVEIRNKTIGIIGLGKIGQRVARILKAFGAKIIVYDPFVDEKDVRAVDGKSVSLEELLTTADLITIHATPTEESIEMIGRRELALMKPTSYIFNLASPIIIDEDALFDFLREKRIAGAGLDVSIDEPIDSTNRFLALDNVVITPHIGGNTKEVIINHSRMILEDIKRYLNNERPLHLLNPEIHENVSQRR